MKYGLLVVRFAFIIALLQVLLLAGCMVGPRYARPNVPTTPTYKEEGPGSFKGVRPVAARAAGRPDKPRKLVGDLWRPGTE